MSNNKQSSLEMMWDEIDNLFPFKDSEELQKFCAILDKYKAMHKEESRKIFECGRNFQLTGEGTFEQVYNETYEGNNE